MTIHAGQVTLTPSEAFQQSFSNVTTGTTNETLSQALTPGQFTVVFTPTAGTGSTVLSPSSYSVSGSTLSLNPGAIAGNGTLMVLGNIARVPYATVTVNLFSGFATGVISDLRLTKAGLSFGSISIGPGTSVTDAFNITNSYYQTSVTSGTTPASVQIPGLPTDHTQLTVVLVTGVNTVTVVPTSDYTIDNSGQFTVTTWPGPLGAASSGTLYILNNKFALPTETLTQTPNSQAPVVIWTTGTGAAAVTTVLPSADYAVTGTSLSLTQLPGNAANTPLSGTLTAIYASGSPTVSIGGFLSITNPSLSITNFSLLALTDPNTHTTTRSVNGTINLSGSPQLFPSGSPVTLKGSVDATYDFSGSLSSGQLSITITGFDLNVAGLLDVSTGVSGVVTLNPTSEPVDTFTVTPSTTSETLSQAPTDPTQVMVLLTTTVNGKSTTSVVNSSQYSISGSTLTLNGSLGQSGTLTVTPIVVDVTSATATLIPLNNLQATVTNLKVTKSGFTFDNASVTLGNVTLGGLFQLQAPSLSINNFVYMSGGGLSGQVTFTASQAYLSLDPSGDLNPTNPLVASIQTIGASYDLNTGTLAVTTGQLLVQLPVGSISASATALSYQPQADGTSAAKVLVGATGVVVAVGAPAGSNSPHFELQNGTLALAVYLGGGHTTYALDITGSFAVVGFPSALQFSAASIEARANTTGAPVNESISVGGVAVPLVFGAVQTDTFTSPSTAFTSVTLNQTPTDNSSIKVAVAQPAQDTVASWTGTSTLSLTQTPDSAFPVSVSYTPTGGSAVTLNQGTDFTLALSGNQTVVNFAAGRAPPTGASVTVSYSYSTSATNFTAGTDAQNHTTLTFGPGAPAAGTTVKVTYYTGSYNVNSLVVSGMKLSVANVAQLTGNFAITSQTVTLNGPPVRELLIGASSVSASLGDSSMGLQLTGGSLGLELYTDPIQQQTVYALDVLASASLTGFGGSISLSGSVEIRANTTGRTISDSITTGGAPFNLQFTSAAVVNASLTASALSVNIAGFVTLTGNFSFQQTSTASGPGSSTEIQIGGTDITAFLGADEGTANETGLKISGATFGLILFRQAGAQPTYALVAGTQTATLEGITGLTLSIDKSPGSTQGLAVMINTTGQAIDRTISTPGGNVEVKFTDGTGNTADQRLLQDIQGNITLGVDPANSGSPIAQLTGQFAFIRSTDPATGNVKLLVGATGVSMSVGTPSVGFGITNGQLALAVYTQASGATQSYALDLSGTAVLNLSAEFAVSGNLELRVNNTGHAVNETIHVLGNTLPLVFTVSTVSDSFLVSTTNTALQLSQVPSAGLPITLSYTAGTPQTDSVGSWVASANTITLTQTPTSPSNVVVSYSNTGSGPFTTMTAGSDYTLSTDANGHTVVTVTRQVQAGATVQVVYPYTVSVNASAWVTVSGGVASLNLPTGTVPAGTNIRLTYSVGEANVTEFVAKGLSIGIGPVDSNGNRFVNLTGDFAFQQIGSGNAASYQIGAVNVNASIGLTEGSGASAQFTGVSITGASLGLLVNSDKTYALVVNGGTDSVQGIPGLQLSASGLLVKVSTVPNTVNQTITIPGAGSVTLSFGKGEIGPFYEVEGHITLQIANLGPVSGDFGLQKVSDGSGGSYLAIGMNNVNIVLGTTDTNLTIANASFGLLIHKPLGAAATYALVSSSGIDTLNGIPDLSLTGSLSVMYNNGVNTSAPGIPASVQTPSGSVALNFTSVAAGQSVLIVTGTASLNIANFVSITDGSFTFQESNDPSKPTLTKILVGVSVPQAFIGDGSVGLSLSNITMALVIYRDSGAAGSTYALNASIGNVRVTGLPPEITLSGSANLQINTTNAAVNQSVTVAGTPLPIQFTDGTNSTPDQRNFKSFGGSLNLSISAGSDITFTAGGSFSITTTTTGTLTKTIIGAVNVNGSVNSASLSASVGMSNGQLGLVMFNDTSKPNSSGYALYASATASITVAGSSAKATVSIRRNTTSAAVNENVSVNGAVIPVVFSATEVAKGGTAFNSVSVSNGSLTIAGLITLTAGNITQSGNTYTATNATLSFGDPSQTGVTLFSLSAGSVTYTSGANWSVQLTNVQLSLGGYVVISAGSVSITPDSVTSAMTHVNLSHASVSLYYNSTLYLSVTASLSFHFGGADGFGLDNGESLQIEDFQVLPGLTGSSTGGGQTQTVVHPLGGTIQSTGTHTLGPITLGTPAIHFHDFHFAPGGVISIQVELSDPLAQIALSSFTAKFSNLDLKFNLSFKLNLSHPLSPPTDITFNNFTATVGQFELDFGTFLVLKANNVAINPQAGPGQDLLSFGGGTAPGTYGLSAELKAGPLDLLGGASNFAIEGDGSLVTKNNFAIALAAGQNTASAVSWPSWLPITNLSVTIQWPGNNFNTNPSNFILILSADVTTPSFLPSTVNFSGSVTGIQIDVAKLAAGQFPIIGIAGVGVNIGGTLFGGVVDGSIIIGTVKFDSHGNVIADTDTTTPVANEVFYGGLEGHVNIAGLGEVGLRIGLSQYGPLSFYIEAPIPILLDPDTGLSLTNLRGGFDLKATLPTPSDPRQLRSSTYAPPLQMDEPTWRAQMIQQVITFHNNPPASIADVFLPPLEIHAGATLYDAYLSQNAFRADVDLTIALEMNAQGQIGVKLLLTGTVTFGDSFSAKGYFFLDLTQIQAGHASVLFLLDVPSPISSTPIFSLFGSLSFQFLDANHQMVDPRVTHATYFNISLSGGADFTYTFVTFEVTGNLSMTFSSSSFELQFSGYMSIVQPNIGQVAEVGGDLMVNNNNGTIEVYGVIYGQFDLNLSEGPFVLSAHGAAEIDLNTTNRDVTVSLFNTPVPATTVTAPPAPTTASSTPPSSEVPPKLLPNTPTEFTLKPTSFEIQVGGQADLVLGGFHVLRIQGALDFQITSTQLTFFVDSELDIGPINSPLMKFSAEGLLIVSYGANPGFAASINLTASGAMAGVSNTFFDASLLLEINTFGTDQTYQVPTLLQQFVGNTPITIPGGPRGLDGSIGSPGSYVTITGRGQLSLLGVFNEQGAFHFQIDSSGFQMQLAGSLSLAPLGTLSVNGSLRISSAGLVGILTVQISAGSSVIGFSGEMQAEINTSSSAQSLPRFTVDSSGNITGTQTVTISAATFRIFIGGTMNIFNVVKIRGSFELTVTSSFIVVQIDASLTLFGFNLGVKGFAGLYFDDSPGIALDIMLSLSSPINTDIFSLNGNFELKINTTGHTRSAVFPDGSALSIAPHFFEIAVTHVDLNILGFDFTGSLYITLSGSYFRIEIPKSDPLQFSLFGIVTLYAYGFLDSNGEFDLAAGAHFQLGDPSVVGIEGNISIEIFSYWDPATGIHHVGFHGHVDGSAHFLIFGVSLSGDLSVDGTLVHVSLEACVSLLFFTVCGSVDFQFGSLDYPPPPPTLASYTGGGTVVLNLGQNRGTRNAGSGSSNETFVIEQTDYVDPSQAPNPSVRQYGDPNGETIKITAFGVTEIYSGIDQIVINTADGNETIQISQGVTAKITVNGPSSAASSSTFHVSDYGSGDATINVRGYSNGTAGNITILAGTGTNTITASSASGSVTLITTGSGRNYITGGAGQTYIMVPVVTGQTTITGGTGSTYIYVGSSTPPAFSTNLPTSGSGGNLSGIAANLAITGAGTTVVYLDDTANPSSQAGAMSYNASSGYDTLTGLGMAGSGSVQFKGLTLDLLLSSRGNSMSVLGVPVGQVNLYMGAGQNSVVVGDANNPLNSIVGALDVIGSGRDTLAVTDAGSSASKTGDPSSGGNGGKLNATTLIGFGMGQGITYSGITNLAVTLGSGGDDFWIATTHAGTNTTVNGGSGADHIRLLANSSSTFITTGGGADTVDIQANAANTTVTTQGTVAATINIGSTGNVLSTIAALVTVQGQGLDTLVLKDNGSSTAGETGLLSATSITGLGMAQGVQYRGVRTLNLSLGTGGYQFSVVSTNSITSTTVTVATTSQTSTFKVGSLSPGLGGYVDNIQGALAFVGAGQDVLKVDDTGSTKAKAGALAGVLTNDQLSGMGMGSGGIMYSGLKEIDINLGFSGNLFTIASTFSSTVTRLTTDANDVINVQTTSDVTYVTTQSGSNTIHVGTLAPNTGGVLSGIQGALIIAGTGNDTLYLDDTGTAAGASESGVLASTTLNGMNMGKAGGTDSITYSGLANLYLTMGQASYTFAVTSTYQGSKGAQVTTVTTGSGTNTVNIGSNAASWTGSSQFTLLHNPVTTLPIVVSYSAALLQGADYTLTADGSGNTVLSFLHQPPTGATVSATYGYTQTTTDALAGSWVINSTFTLQHSPLGAVVVSYASSGSTTAVPLVQGTDYTLGHDATGNTVLTLLRALPDGSTVNATYQFNRVTTEIGPSPWSASSVFTLLHTPAGNVSVTYTVPLTQGPGGYTLGIDPVSGKYYLSLQTTLPAGAQISATYSYTAVQSTTESATAEWSTATALPLLHIPTSTSAVVVTYTTSANSTPTVLTQGTDYTLVKDANGNETVHFINAPPAGALVSVSYTFQTTQSLTQTVSDPSAGANLGTLTHIQGRLNIVGGGRDTVNVDDTGAAGAMTGTLTEFSLTGLGLGAPGIGFSGTGFSEGSSLFGAGDFNGLTGLVTKFIADPSTGLLPGMDVPTQYLLSKFAALAPDQLAVLLNVDLDHAAVGGCLGRRAQRGRPQLDFDLRCHRV